MSDPAAPAAPHPESTADLRGAAFAPPLRETVGGALGVVAIHLALGVYAVHLNRLFYERFGPFFDSVSYLNRLVDLQVAAAEGGLGRVLSEATRGSTVALPWLLFAPFAGGIALDRAIGVWIQVAIAAVASLALFRYFHAVRRESVGLSIAFACSVSFIAAAFRFNGGLADFRMDLLQALLVTLTMAVYLQAREQMTWLHWGAVGLSVGVLCLGRATSPVYVVLCAAVLLPLDLAASPVARRETLGRWALAGAVATATAGWFYVWNFELLRHYYLEWNPDALARLPVAESYVHLRLAAGHLGLPLGGAALVVLLSEAVRMPGLRLRELNIRPLLFSVVPLGVLVLAGAGLNPFVSIVGVPGALLFLLAPSSGVARPRSRRERWALAALVVSAALWSAAAGVPNQTRLDRDYSWVPRQPGLEAVVDALAREAAGAGAGAETTFCTAHVGTLHGAVIRNRLVFDLGGEPLKNGGVRFGASVLRELALPRPGAIDGAWERLGGATDGGRVAELARRVEAGCDLFVVPTADSALPTQVASNRLVGAIVERLFATGSWRPLTGAIALSDIEAVRVVRNVRRLSDEGRAPGS